jgi:adenylate cyclase
MRHESPAARVGMPTGHAIERAGDWYGTTVNLAARVACVAGGGEVLLTDATRLAAGSLAGVEFKARGFRRFKNVTEPVALHSVESNELSPRQAWPIDPVCRMAIDPTIPRRRPHAGWSRVQLLLDGVHLGIRP